jgi:hypothetical protein
LVIRQAAFQSLDGISAAQPVMGGHNIAELLVL